MLFQALFQRLRDMPTEFDEDLLRRQEIFIGFQLNFLFDAENVIGLETRCQFVDLPTGHFDGDNLEFAFVRVLTFANGGDFAFLVVELRKDQLVANIVSQIRPVGILRACLLNLLLFFLGHPIPYQHERHLVC